MIFSVLDKMILNFNYFNPLMVDAEQQHVEHLANQNPAAQNPQLPHVNDPAAQNDLQLPGNPAAENEPPPAENPAAQNENQNENQLQNDDQNENLPQNGDPVENEQESKLF